MALLTELPKLMVLITLCQEMPPLFRLVNLALFKLRLRPLSICTTKRSLMKVPTTSLLHLSTKVIKLKRQSRAGTINPTTFPRRRLLRASPFLLKRRPSSRRRTKPPLRLLIVLRIPSTPLMSRSASFPPLLNLIECSPCK